MANNQGESTEDIYGFLRKRMVSEDELNRMKEDKIDEIVIVNMDASDLVHYLPKYGDRLAAINYCKLSASGCETPKKRGKIRDILRSKLSTTARPFTRSLALLGNKNAKKDVRKVTLGWVHFDKYSKTYKQVRGAFNGGGTRKLELPKSYIKSDIVETSKQLFFKSGKSSKGSWEELDKDILNCHYEPMTTETTIGVLFDEDNITTLRLYLGTIKKENTTKDEAVPTKTKTLKINIQESNTDLNSSDDFEHESTLNTKAKKPKTFVFDDDLPDLQSTQKSTIECGATSESEVLFIDIIQEEPSEEILQQLPEEIFDPSLQQLPEEIFEPSIEVLVVRRGFIFDDLLSFFCNNPGLTDSEFQIKIRLPNGEIENAEGIGVLRDALTEFWQEFYDRCTTGCDNKIPFIRHDFKEKQWTTVAQVLSAGFRLVKYFPIQLSQPFLEQVFFNKTTSDLTNSFLSFVSQSEREVLKKALEEFTSVDSEELLDILGTYECRKIPNENNVKTLIEEISHKVTIQAPMFIIDCWRPVLENLFSSTQFNSVLQDYVPTTRNVLSHLSFPENPAEEGKEVMNHLKKYVRSLSPDYLTKFLRFCTGCNHLFGANIMVNFLADQTLFTRRPLASTCAMTLTLPTNYDTYADFRNDFNKILGSNVWTMDFK